MDNRINLIKKLIMPDCNDNELELFFYIQKKLGLDALAHQIYAQKFGGKYVFSLTIDGWRVIAERSGKYRGQVGPEWCGEDGSWKDIWVSDDTPKACRVGILKEGFDQPIWGKALYKTASKEKSDGNLKDRWAKDAVGMLAKCAEMNGFKRAFPIDINSLPETQNTNEPQTLEIVESWIDDRVGFKKTGRLTWRDLLENEQLPESQECGRQYLHKLASWTENKEASLKAKKLLAIYSEAAKKEECKLLPEITEGS